MDTSTSISYDSDGGKLIDEGSYSCIFYPNLKCKTGTEQFAVTSLQDKKYIDKLLNINEAEYEFEISKKILKLPLNKNYFIVSESICQPAPAPLQTNTTLDKCDLLQEISLSQTRILRSVYGGTTLAMYRIKLNDFSFYDMFKHLLEGSSILALYGFIHRDIHLSNILIDNKNVPRIIDFNLCLNINNKIGVADLTHKYNATLFQQSPDYTLINAIINGRDPQATMKSIITTKNLLKTMQGILGISLQTMYDNLDEFYSNSPFMQKGDILGWFNSYWTKIDSWSIGLIMIYFLKQLLLYPQFQLEWKKISKQYLPIIKKLCEINPKKRVDCIQALAKLDPQNYIIRKYCTNWLNKVGTGF